MLPLGSSRVLPNPYKLLTEGDKPQMQASDNREGRPDGGSSI